MTTQATGSKRSRQRHLVNVPSVSLSGGHEAEIPRARSAALIVLRQTPAPFSPSIAQLILNKQLFRIDILARQPHIRRRCCMAHMAYTIYHHRRSLKLKSLKHFPLRQEASKIRSPQGSTYLGIVFHFRDPHGPAALNHTDSMMRLQELCYGLLAVSFGPWPVQ